MKNRISIIIFLAATLGISSTGMAQSNATASLGKTTIGFRAGVNFQNLNGKDQDGNMVSHNMVVRWHAGANVEIPVAIDFYLQPGLLFTTKGAHTKSTLNGVTYQGDLGLNYLEVPINLVYKPLVGTGHLILGFGPYIAYGVGGRAIYWDDNNPKQRERVKFTNRVEASTSTAYTYFRPFDAGANLMFGYEFSNRISVQLNAQLGMLKVNSEYYNVPNDKSTIKNTGFGLSLGYRL